MIGQFRWMDREHMMSTEGAFEGETAAGAHSWHFLSQIVETANALDVMAINEMALALSQLRYRGRLFILGVGGSAANASHAVNDFRKLCDIEAYAPTDNVAELTARINDDGWEYHLVEWLKASRFEARDAILVLSVGGGGDIVSEHISAAVCCAKDQGLTVLGIVGRDGGYTKQHADHCILIPVDDKNLVTPITESFQSVVLHMLVSHPLLATQKAKWESVEEAQTPWVPQPDSDIPF